jgi:hypothetical protein
MYKINDSCCWNIDICLIGIQYVKDTHQCGQDYVKFCGFGGISVDIGAKSRLLV